MKRVTFLSALLIWSLLVACGPSAPAATPTPEPTPTPVEIVADSIDDIVGIWACNYGGQTYYAQFLADGAVRLAESVQRLENAPFATGKVWFEGTVFNETDTKCTCGTGTYDVLLVREGGKTRALRWKEIEDCCGERSGCYRGLTPRASGQ
jgi:hypothetical protein